MTDLQTFLVYVPICWEREVQNNAKDKRIAGVRFETAATLHFLLRRDKYNKRV